MDESGRIPHRADKSQLHEMVRRRLEARHLPERPVPEPFTNVELGNKDAEYPLPISDYKELIRDTVHKNPVTIIVAETGAGKSTQVPQYLLQAGYKVNMTQPRRLAARMLGERIGDEIAEAFDDPEASLLVGVHTAERNTNPDERYITVLTDGLRLVQELNARGDIEDEVLIIDEVHEWNKNIEVLVAWTKKLVKEKPTLRVVIMSATMDAHKLAEYFSDTGAHPPIIEVPGRTFGVEKIEEPHSTVLEETLKYTKDGNNILVFLPGVREIDNMKRNLDELFMKQGIHGVTVLPLHGKLSDQEQKAVDGHYPGPKIILSTNVAQTSLTIKDIDVVVDSGLERRIEIDGEGVQSLREHSISRADCDQRAGRAGRTHEGVYVLTKIEKDTEFNPYINRDAYPTPEILRSDVDQNTLAIAAAGLDFSELDLFHPVDRQTLLQSRHRLQLIGALDDEGKITQRGRRMNQFPVHPTSARMLIESERFSDETRAYVATVVAAIEVGKLPSFLHNSGREWRRLTTSKTSDHLAQLDIFIGVQGMSERDMKQLGLDVRNVERARELQTKILKRARIPTSFLESPSTRQQEEIIECVTAGLIDFVYESAGNGKFLRAIGHTATEREISNRSTVSGSPTHLVGMPYAYEDKRRGEQSIIEDVSVIKLELLGKIGVNLCVYEDSGSVKWRNGQPFSEKKEMFRGMLPTGRWQEEAAEPSAGLRKEIIEYVLKNPGNAQKALRKIKKDLEDLRRLAGEKAVPSFTQENLRSYIEDKRVTPNTITDPSLVDENLRRLMLQQDISLESFITTADQNEIYKNSPEYITHNGIEVRLTYSRGDASTHINDLSAVPILGGEIYLKDGRQIQLKYQGKRVSHQELLQLASK